MTICVTKMPCGTLQGTEIALTITVKNHYCYQTLTILHQLLWLPLGGFPFLMKVTFCKFSALRDFSTEILQKDTELNCLENCKVRRILFHPWVLFVSLAHLSVSSAKPSLSAERCGDSQTLTTQKTVRTEQEPERNLGEDMAGWGS